MRAYVMVVLFFCRTTAEYDCDSCLIYFFGVEGKGQARLLKGSCAPAKILLSVIVCPLKCIERRPIETYDLTKWVSKARSFLTESSIF